MRCELAGAHLVHAATIIRCILNVLAPLRVSDSKYGLQAGVLTHDLDKVCCP